MCDNSCGIIHSYGDVGPKTRKDASCLLGTMDRMSS